MLQKGAIMELKVPRKGKIRGDILSTSIDKFAFLGYNVDEVRGFEGSVDFGLSVGVLRTSRFGVNGEDLKKYILPFYCSL